MSLVSTVAKWSLINMEQRVPMTPEGKKILQDELNQLKSHERFKIVNEIEVARAHGDLRENAEYHAAKEKQGMIEARIRFLEDQLSRSEVIDPSKLDSDRVVFGMYVTVFDVKQDKKLRYRIVGDNEANLDKGFISVNSPISKGLIGKEIGDSAVIDAPGGKRELEIISIGLE